jgi:hypothetical protein
MKKRLSLTVNLLLIFVISLLLVSCQTQSTDLSSKGRITGLVTDKKDMLPAGVIVQYYEGAAITIYKAVESGTSKIGTGFPEQKNYGKGDKVTEVKSVKEGKWQVDLEPGMYFIRAFYGKSSYSEEKLLEIKKGETRMLNLELIHGI